jgi:glutamyl-tRNA synthetase
MTLREMIDQFSIDRIGKANAKFDRDKLLAFNTDAAAAATPDRLLAGFADYLCLNDTPIPSGDEAMLRRLLEITKGFRTFADIPAKCGVLFGPDDGFVYDEQAVKKVLEKSDAAGYAVLADLRDKLAAVDWSAGAEGLEKFLADYCQAANLGLGKVAQPLRVAVTGTAISPSIGQTLDILGRERTLARINRCLAARQVGQ